MHGLPYLYLWHTGRSSRIARSELRRLMVMHTRVYPYASVAGALLSTVDSLSIAFYSSVANP